MSSVSWLHVTDLHKGAQAQHWLWPNVREQLFADLARLHDRCGPWDLLFFTGDLTNAGVEDDFGQLDATLGELWQHLRSLGSDPTLCAVPGNHDLVRPNHKEAAVRL